MSEKKPYVSALIILDGPRTRPYARYATLELANQAAAHEDDMRAAPDHLIIHAKSIMGSLEDGELEALRTALGVDPGPRPQVQQEVRQRLLAHGELREALTEGAARRAAEELAQLGRRATKATTTTTQVNEKVADMAAKKSKQKTTAPKKGAGKKGNGHVNGSAGPKAPRAEAKGDGLGREGTLTRFLCEGITAGRDDKQLLDAARKKFPDRKVGDHYVQWYRNQLKKKGLLKAAS